MARPYGYAGLYHDTVYAIGRSEAGMRRDLAEQDESPELDSVVPCTRRAFDAVRAGQVQVHTPRQAGERAVLVLINGTLDVPRGVGRPPRDPSGAGTPYAIRVPAALHARVMALPAAQRAKASVAMIDALEDYLAGLDAVTVTVAETRTPRY